MTGRLFVPTIKSYGFDQEEIIRDIMHLRGIERFDADVTYGNGAFYRNLPQPIHKFDIQPLAPDVEEADSGDIPLATGSVQSIMFDPPFLTYVSGGRDHGSIMSKRFGGYWAYSELEEHYRRTIAEAARLISHRGTLVVKCQDIIHNHKMHPTHINVFNWASDWFRLADLYVLLANRRLPNTGTQQHARIHHSYFMVFERNGQD